MWPSSSASGTRSCVWEEVLQTSGPIPNPIQWLAWSDATLADLGETVDAERLFAIATLFHKCPRSGHLWFFWDGNDQRPWCHALLGPSEARPGAVGWKVVSDEAFDEVEGNVRTQAVAESAVALLRSPAADRLWIAWEGPGGPVSAYAALAPGWDPLGQDDQPGEDDQLGRDDQA